MKTLMFFLLPIFLVLINGKSFSQYSRESKNQFPNSELTSKIVNQNSTGFEKEKVEISSGKPGEKSPYLGALFSGIIPGTGEFYSQRYLKGAIFLAVEAGLWIAYANFENKGDDQTAQFQAFADQNWSINKYAQWLVDQQFTDYNKITNPQNPDHNQLRHEVNQVEAVNFSHQLPPFGAQQYYELIGKYQNFVAGWADASGITKQNYITFKTPMFTDYSYDRQEANDYYNDASTMTALIIANHLLSAADGAWSVSMFNKDLKVKTSVNMEKIYSFYGDKELIPVAKLNVIF